MVFAFVLDQVSYHFYSIAYWWDLIAIFMMGEDNFYSRVIKIEVEF